MESELSKISTAELEALSRHLQAKKDEIRASLKAINDEISRRSLEAQVTERWSRMSEGEKSLYRKMLQPESVESGESFGKI